MEDLNSHYIWLRHVQYQNVLKESVLMCPVLQKQLSSKKTRRDLAHAIWEGKEGEHVMSKQGQDLKKAMETFQDQPNNADKG